MISLFSIPRYCLRVKLPLNSKLKSVQVVHKISSDKLIKNIITLTLKLNLTSKLTLKLTLALNLNLKFWGQK